MTSIVLAAAISGFLVGLFMLGSVLSGFFLGSSLALAMYITDPHNKLPLLGAVREREREP